MASLPPLLRGTYQDTPESFLRDDNTPDSGKQKVDLIYRDPEEVEKEEREKAEAAAESQMVKAPDFVAPDKEDWGADTAVTECTADGQAAAYQPPFLLLDLLPQLLHSK